MSFIRIAGIKKHSFVDGPGIRFTIFTQGCPHHCEACHNQGTWDTEGGILADTKELVRQLCDTKYLDGITLSGGDPFMQGEACLELAQAAHEKGLSVWAYTGWTYEQLISGEAGLKARRALQEIDVLVDGRFDRHQTSGGHAWRGSANQRLIDVKASLSGSQPVLYDDAQDLLAANM